MFWCNNENRWCSGFTCLRIRCEFKERELRMKCDNCKEKCPQEELACEIAKGMQHATKEVIYYARELYDAKKLLEKAAEELENVYGNETELTEAIRAFLDKEREAE